MSANSHGNNTSIPGVGGSVSHNPNHDGKCPDSLSDHGDYEDDYVQDDNPHLGGVGGGGILEMKSFLPTII